MPLTIRRTAFALVLVLVLALLARATAMAAEPSGAPYEMNAVVPLTGPGAFLGSALTQTFKALEMVVNETGGIGGRPLKFVVADSTSAPPVSLQLMNSLIAKNVPLVIDGGPSFVCNPTIALVKKSGPLDYCLSNAVHPDSGSYAFSTGVSTTDFTEVLIRYLRLRGWTRLALITGTDATGADFDVQVARVLQMRENADVTIVEREHFNPGDLSVAAQMTRIKAAAPQVVMTWSTGTPFGTVLHGLRDAGLDVPVTAVPSNQNFAQMAQYASFLPRLLYFPSHRAVAQTGTGKGPIRDAQMVYFNAFKRIGVRPDFATNLAWDPVMIMVSGLRTIGPNATAEQLRNYIEGLHSWAGINGIYDFRGGDQRGIGQNAIDVQRWDQTAGDFVAVSKPGGAPL
jgi:branched-chain amino acid transport system substrate-binding protein